MTNFYIRENNISGVKAAFFTFGMVLFLVTNLKRGTRALSPGINAEKLRS